MKRIFTKAILLLALIGLSYTHVKAQYVTIPDTIFRNWLIQEYPSCFNVSQQMDTTCAQIVNSTSLFFNSLGISDLTGISYFDNLEDLNCNYNQISVFPTLPSTLINLECVMNQLVSLPNLPIALNTLKCGNNQLTTLPNLPNTLNWLQCDNNQLNNLPSLPSALGILFCSHNQLTNLPTLPFTLTDLNCDYNQLTSLPNLPAGLDGLSCEQNLLTTLPNLPVALSYMNCRYNQLTILPWLPDNLNYLLCSYNMITLIPNIPNGMGSLNCSFNQISILPPLPPTMYNLHCQSNLIYCFPNFPQGLTVASNFNISNNPFTCLPNYVSAMNTTTLSLPLCNSSNLNGCLSASGISGTVYKDAIPNCELDSGDLLIKHIKVNFFNPLNNQFGMTYTFSNGVFNYPASVGTYFALVDTLNKPYQSNCTFPGIDTTVVTTLVNQLASNVNFDIKCKTGLDLNVQSVNHENGLIFPGQQHTLQIMAGDASQWYGLDCANGINGQVQITVTGPLVYNGIPAGALTPNINGNVYTYPISDFGTNNNADNFQMLFTIDTTAQAGEQICVHVEVTPNSGDINPENNINNYCYTIQNSYDPNYKEVYPTDVAPLFQDWLTYTVHFQNLGTAPAINIRLLDTLDANLDAETFEVINYSHYNTVTLMDGILDFRFPNILLPDSASNPSGSQGFVQYRIKPKANLPAGTQIENTAHIYFDYNPAVVTNTTVNNFTTTVGLSNGTKVQPVSIYPNPSQGIFNLSATANIEVYNIIGELVVSEINATSIDLTAAPKGLYFVKLNGNKIEKLIKN